MGGGLDREESLLGQPGEQGSVFLDGVVLSTLVGFKNLTLPEVQGL